MSKIIGKQYRFNYPKEFKCYPDYTEQNGKIVVVTGLVPDSDKDEEVEPMYKIALEDKSWMGEAFESELEEI